MVDDNIKAGGLSYNTINIKKLQFRHELTANDI